MRFLSVIYSLAIFLFAAIVFFAWSTVSAQTPIQELRAKEYCARGWYDGCQDYWYEKSAAVDQVMTGFKKSIDAKPTAFGLRQVEQYDKNFSLLQEQYDGMWMGVFVAYIRDYFKEWIAEYELDLQSIYVPISAVSQPSGSLDALVLRRMIVGKLVEKWFNSFNSSPRPTWANGLLTADDAMQYSLGTTLYSNDSLDMYISQLSLKTGQEELMIRPELWTTWENIHLFKSTDDLKSLWYEVVSHRSRFNYDEAYRRTNIATAFAKIGHIRVLNPGQSFSFLDESQFDPSAQANYEYGKVIFLDEEVDDYGGWLCGASTAIYQGIVTNTALSRPALRNHSKRYTSLYTATIDGQKISTPGIDSTIYSRSLDLVLKNTATYPIVLVMNYDGTYQSEEEVFTLGRASDKWNVTYISKYPYQTSIMKNGKSQSITGTCYVWNINGQNKESCYKEVH